MSLTALSVRTMFAASVRAASRRSYVTDAPKAHWVDDLGKILHDTGKQVQAASKAASKAPKRTNTLNYRLFHPDTLITERALTFDTCRSTRPPPKRFAPPPSMARYRDVFHQLRLDPRDFSTNSVVLSSFVSEMGKIKPRHETMLTLKSQRLLGRTIRRAKMMGVMPNLSRY